MISILTIAAAGAPPRDVKPEEFPPLLASAGRRLGTLPHPYRSILRKKSLPTQAPFLLW
jgi:hypothetical protein